MVKLIAKTFAINLDYKLCFVQRGRTRLSEVYNEKQSIENLELVGVCPRWGNEIKDIECISIYTVH